ncbi:MAG: hypothetical protein F6K58_17095 [Symploca sp. SIO2E9]|nr:hypothetical protein [Symploca sp. SIO2E9]
MNTDKPELMKCFLDFSVEVTGFSLFDLQGTGQAPLYFDTIWGVIGGEMFRELLQAFQQSCDVEKILASPKLGPIARNIIKLWYIATWEQLPPVWREKFRATLNDSTFIASPYAYTEGLLWPAIGINPPAAKAPGYGTWSMPPKIKPVPPKAQVK